MPSTQHHTLVNENELVTEGAMPPDDFHLDIERIHEVYDYDLEVPKDLLRRLEAETSHLLIDKNLLIAAATALQVGHLILQGPPGTGKSSLARCLCRAFHCSPVEVTAHQEWTTYQVIGHQTLTMNESGQEEVSPSNGFFTEAVIRCASNIVRHFDSQEEPQAAWLLIDELNRAEIDKAFGELFTVLGTDEMVPIALQYQTTGNREMVVPRRFRLIATLNSIDRQFVNSIGQGLKRRFSFLTVDIPGPRQDGEDWGEPGNISSLASKEFTVVLQRATERAVGRFERDGAELQADACKRLVESQNFQNASRRLFDLVGQVRYADEESDRPYLPIGTAQLIDTVELFIVRATLEAEPSAENLLKALDWAVSVKLAPLFDTDTISPAQLRTFTESLEKPFDILLKRELQQVVAAGQYYVK